MTPDPAGKTYAQADPDHWIFKKLAGGTLSWFKRI